jgi:hypothetical protein
MIRNEQLRDAITQANGGVDAAARINAPFAGPVMMRNTLPPLASNDLLARAKTRPLALL